MRRLFRHEFAERADTLTDCIRLARERGDGLTDHEIDEFSDEIRILNEVLMAKSLGITVQELLDMPALHFQIYQLYYLKGLADET